MSALDKVACSEGNIRAVYRFKAKGQDLNEGNAEGIRGLMKASSHNHLNIAKYLVGRGAILDTANSFGYTALMVACRNAHLDVSRFLCESGTDVNALS